MDLWELFSTVLNMSLTGSIVIVFVLLARLLLRKAPKVFSYALWAVVLFRLLCPVSISSAVSLLSFTKAPVSRPAGVVTAVDYFPAESGREETFVQHTPAAMPELQVNQSLSENGAEVMPTPDAVSQQAAAEPAHEPVRYAVIIWLAGIGVMLLCSLATYWKLLRKLRGAVRLRKNIYLADHIPSPFVLGLVSPRIYLPSVLEASEREYIIAHERYHIRRMDHIIKLLAYGALCLHWFNPLVWAAFTLSGKDMEMSCDEAVIKKLGPRIRADYAASLLRLATEKRIIAATPLAFGEGDTKGRVLNMAKWKKPRLWVMICAAVVCVGVLVACAVNPADDGQTKSAAEEYTTLQWAQELKAEDVAFIELVTNTEGSGLRYNRIDDRERIGEILTCINGIEGEFVPSCSTEDDDANVTYYFYDSEEKWRSVCIRNDKYVSVGDSFFLVDPAVMDSLRAEATEELPEDFEKRNSEDSMLPTPESEKSRRILESEAEWQAEHQEAFFADTKLGSGSCNWYLTDDFVVNTSATGVTPTGVVMNFEYLRSAVSGEVTIGETFWLEKWDGSAYCPYPGETAGPISDGKGGVLEAEGSESLEISWEAAYGPLEPGFYLVGRTLTARAASGDPVTKDCYAKFRVINEAEKELLDQCRDGLEALLSGETYHVFTTQWLKRDESGYYITTEVWKHGTDYLQETRYVNKKDSSILEGRHGSLWRDGITYNLEWSGDTVHTPVSSWQANTYMDEWNFTLWTAALEALDAWVEQVEADGNTIRIRWPYNFSEGQYEYQELAYAFDDTGSLTEITFAYLPAQDCAEKDKVIETEMKVLGTSAGEIRQVIDAQDVGKPAQFSFADDAAANPAAKTEGFVNMEPTALGSIPEVINHALKDCTLPETAGLIPGTNIMNLSYDEGAKMWRVEFTFSADDSVYQAVYLDQQGITRMVVTK